MDAINPELLRGSLELMVLSTLSTGKKYGYLIQSTLWESSRAAIEMKAGTLYPILHKLEKEGWVKCHWENDTGRRRKWYELTALGKKQLKCRADEWWRYVECLRSILGPAGDLQLSQSEQIVRVGSSVPSVSLWSVTSLNSRMTGNDHA